MTSTSQDGTRRKRSRSPFRDSDHGVKRHRSRSPRRKHHHHHHHRHEPAQSAPKPKPKLPFRQKPLDKKDFDEYRILFAHYLDVQKNLDIDELSRDEAKGRWKSFMGRWNRLELSEGWYDPEMKTRAETRWKEEGPVVKTEPSRSTVLQTQKAGSEEDEDEDEDDEDDDGYGPSLPSRKSGPAIPSLDDLQHRRELASEDRSNQTADLRYERKTDRAAQKERLEELAPRADPGSRERQLEKKRDTAAVNREFRDAKDSGDVEVGERDLMGEDGIGEYKKKMKENEKAKNEREVRKEEVLRARAAEREERMKIVRQKEEKTMEMLSRIAKERFG